MQVGIRESHFFSYFASLTMMATASWWRDQRPRSFFSFVYSLASTEDRSAFSTDEEELDAALPVLTPYFAAVNGTTGTQLIKLKTNVAISRLV